MIFKVYWTRSEQPFSEDFSELTEALKFCEKMRSKGCQFVTMVSENPNNVGKPGAAGIEAGLLPDGSKYSWTKEDRVGAAFKTPAPISTDNLEVDLDDPF